MKKNKKLNSIATMSKEELQEVNGGLYLIGYPDVFPKGIPVDICKLNCCFEPEGERKDPRNDESKNDPLMNKWMLSHDEMDHARSEFYRLQPLFPEILGNNHCLRYRTVKTGTCLKAELPLTN